MSAFKDSKNRLTVLLEANVASDFMLRSVLIYYSKNPRILRIILNLICLCSQKQNKKTYMTTHPFTTWFTDYLSPLLRPMFRPKKKKITFKTITVH